MDLFGHYFLDMYMVVLLQAEIVFNVYLRSFTSENGIHETCVEFGDCIFLLKLMQPVH